VKVATLTACGPARRLRDNEPPPPVVRLNLPSRPVGAAARLASIVAPTPRPTAAATSALESVRRMREIELERAESSIACGDDDSTVGDDDSDDCEELEFGPVLVDVPLGAGPARALSVEVAPGLYEKLEFEIHKPESSDDAAFIAANPAFDGVSVRVTGSYNGTPFTYTSDLDVEQEQEFAPPLSPATATTRPRRFHRRRHGPHRCGTLLASGAAFHEGGR
jgi:hypothetical protein